MGNTLQLIRSILFNLQMYIAMPLFALFYLPWAIISPHGAAAACHAYSAYVFWSARWMIGLKVEVRGTPPTDVVLIAAKHQSFLDIMMIYHAVPYAKFIMKHELMYAPIFGQFAKRLGSVPVKRGKRGAAIAKMMEDVKKGEQLPGQLVIYAQGTRLAPGAKAPYKVGAGVLYEQMETDCVPVATNAGVFWPRHGMLRKQGTAVVDFLPRIEAGIERDEFMARLETEIETVSEALLDEAGFVRKG